VIGWEQIDFKEHPGMKNDFTGKMVMIGDTKDGVNTFMTQITNAAEETGNVLEVLIAMSMKQ
jgi:hypothetical protein